jgi:ribosomal protein L16/L10AE
MASYDCAQVGDARWAAARVDPGNTVFFLKRNGSSWEAMTADSVCGTASAGFPQTLLSYCAAPSSSPGPSPSPMKCTSNAILAALPGGAAMKKYTCGQVGDSQWAAARVDPGNTVFFLKRNGSTWQAMTADSICGTASAALPQTLLAYCRP